MLDVVSAPADPSFQAFEAYRAVVLRCPVQDGEVLVPVGTRGVIVDVYPDRRAYGVEIASPVEDVIFVRHDDLDAA